MSDEGPLDQFLSASHEPVPPSSVPAQGRPSSPWRERGILLGLGVLLGGIVACALVFSDLAGDVRSLKQSLADERALNVSLRQERDRLLESLDQVRLDSLLHERSPMALVGQGGTASSKARPVPQAPPLTPLGAPNAPVPGSVDDRLVNPGPEDWKERYRYAALKYNQVVEDYNKLRKLYRELVGRGDAAGGVVTGAQFYKALRNDTRLEARKLDERYMKGGLRGSELRELERSRDEMRHRDWWLKKMAHRFKID